MTADQQGLFLYGDRVFGPHGNHPEGLLFTESYNFMIRKEPIDIYYSLLQRPRHMQINL